MTNLNAHTNMCMQMDLWCTEHIRWSNRIEQKLETNKKKKKNKKTTQQIKVYSM